MSAILNLAKYCVFGHIGILRQFLHRKTILFLLLFPKVTHFTFGVAQKDTCSLRVLFLRESGARLDTLHMSSCALKPQTPPTSFVAKKKGTDYSVLLSSFFILTLRLVKGFASRLIRRPLTWALACIVSILCTCLKVSCDWLQHRTRLPTRPHPGDNPTNRHTQKIEFTNHFLNDSNFCIDLAFVISTKSRISNPFKVWMSFRHTVPSPDCLYALNSDNILELVPMESV